MRFPELIANQLHSHPERTWCVIEQKIFTYGDLSHYIQDHQLSISQSEGSIGVVLRNDFETYAALIACWMCGKAYVPLNPDYPTQRLHDIVEASALNWVLDSHNIGLPQIKNLELITKQSLQSFQWKLITAEISDNAYILFTSGTTGKPKGVPITFGNLQAFFDGFWELGYALTDQDKFLQMFELTFDLSVMSFGVPTLLGASFYVPSQKLVKPLALYDTLESENISFALMVPSAVEMLAPYADELELPHLKVSQFCGEALKLSQVAIWAKACPQTQIDNVYGPTEATIYCTRYTVPSGLTDCLHKNGIVCIGKPMKTVSLLLDDTQELCLGGDQTTKGYLHANEEQRSNFFEKDGIWFYKSGDIGSFDMEDYFCHGRSDDQIKIQGYRIELSEIEFAGTKILPETLNRCLAVETINGWELHLVFDTEKIPFDISQVNEHLPEYMHIKEIHTVHPFPLNANGKVDKKALKGIIDANF
jgi:non-ribosomal peptide synthetase component F